ncbi:MAG: type I DNA topoisomerase [Candidatus Tectomicrobia bacterium]|nr:type I DNA topoisomerase [Candidatus Tectomicrobia bacterium]
MAMTPSHSLVVVESPAKARTIGLILGQKFSTLASYGHVRDLPNKPGSVDIERGFEPKYEVLPDSKKHLAKIKEKLASCGTLYLATDLDREGEAIAWHLVEALGLNGSTRGSDGAAASKAKRRSASSVEVKRIVFHEITREAILEAMQHPRDIAYALVDAQKARRVLDYLVGFNLSPFLWKKVRYGLSAGRVQSVALRLICEREREIQAFTVQEYWTITADLSSLKSGGEAATFAARLVELEGTKLDKFDIPNEERARQLVAQFEGADYQVLAVTPKTNRRNPAPPFITSTLQQEASRKLGFSANRTMMLAQRLYEGMDLDGDRTGLITYMRTDSVHLAEVALRECQEVIQRLYGNDYGLKQPRRFKRQVKNAQEAHEAIRPTSLNRLPDSLRTVISEDELKLYDLIWKRTIASQMAQAVIDSVSVDIRADRQAGSGARSALLRATGSTVRFPGFMRVYTEGRDDQEEEQGKALPPLAPQQALALRRLTPEQHFTEPPPRYNEATLVKTLEENGIGRPSTYASIMNTLQQRGYVRLEKKRFFPEEIGLVVNDLLVEHFSKYVDYQFTAHLENELDVISTGKAEWRTAVRNFWEPFIALLTEKEATVKKSDVTEEATKETCPECGKPLVIKLSKYGKFLSCTGFPACKYGRPLEKEKPSAAQEATAETCPNCGKPLVIKLGKYGKFLSCTGFPACKYGRPLEKEKPSAAQETPADADAACENCGKPMVLKQGRYGKFLACTGYPECKTTRKLGGEAGKPKQTTQETDEKCDKCGASMVIREGRFGRFLSCSRYPKCKAMRPFSIGVACPEKGCKGYLGEKRTKQGKLFYGCSRYPDCKFSMWDKPIPERCPVCDHPYLVEKSSKSDGKRTICPAQGCSYSVAAAEVAAAKRQ